MTMDQIYQRPAVFFQNGQISIIEQDKPVLEKGEALIRVIMAGICQTDLELFHGYHRFEGIPGHEFVGLVEQAPDKPELTDQRVVADINCGCGKCNYCLEGQARHCPQRTVIGIKGRSGAFATYLTVPIVNLYKVGPNISDQEAVFAEPLAAVLRISQQTHLKATDRIAVLGDGKLGLLSALALQHFSPNISLLGKHKTKLAMAEKQNIDTQKIDPDQDRKELLKQTGLFDLVVEATGKVQGLDLAIDLTKPLGRIVLKTTSHLPGQLNTASIAIKELQIIGSRCGYIPQALHFLSKKWIDLLPLIETTFPLSQFEKAFQKAQAKQSLKILVSVTA